MEKKELEDIDHNESHPIFDILKKVMGFKDEATFFALITKKEKEIKKIDWLMKPLEESGDGIMQYRVIAKVDGKKIRLESENPYHPSSFSKKSAEILISKMMDDFPSIVQTVDLKRVYVIDNDVFEKVETKAKKNLSM